MIRKAELYWPAHDRRAAIEEIDFGDDGIAEIVLIDAHTVGLRFDDGYLDRVGPRDGDMRFLFGDAFEGAKVRPTQCPYCDPPDAIDWCPSHGMV